ncbi:MAG: phosphatidylserine/phosphatidylglycerophosphate/cardiolipin synthase family protein [Planctomycetota bacterium]
MILRLAAFALIATPAFAVDVYFAPSKDVPETIERTLDSADKSIDLAIYSFTDKRAQSKLIDAAERGVRVRVILHEARKHSKLADAIENAGGDVKYVTKVMHHKFALVDDGLITGSANWSRSAYSRYDEDLLEFDPSDTEDRNVIASFAGEFDHIWRNAKEYGETRFEPGDAVDQENEADAVFTSANLEVTTYRGEPTFRSVGKLPGVCGSRLIKAIQSAKSEIRIASAHFRRFDLHNELLLAMERGVKVRMLLDQQEFHYDRTKTPNALYDEALQKAGADVRYKVYSRFWDYRTALQMHAKYLIVDDSEVLTGSLNWSENAELGTFENLIALTDSSAAAKYIERFEMKWRYGEGRLDALMADVRKNDEPCNFKPLTLNGAQLRELRECYSRDACSD